MIETIDCRAIANEVMDNLKKEIDDKQMNITLGVIRVGDNPSSTSYMKKIQNYCNKLGITLTIKQFPENCTNGDVVSGIRDLQHDSTGVMIQMPLPKHLDVNYIVNELDPDMDVDGITTANMGKLASHSGDYYVPCTANAVIKILEETYKDLDGMNIVVFGRSNVVGKPLALELLNRNATVRVVHSHSRHKPIYYSYNGDVVVSAMGQPHKLTYKDIGGSTICVIDCGVTMVNGELQGDVDLDSFNELVDDYDLMVTKVPGGVGSVTTAMLMSNLVEAWKRHHSTLLAMEYTFDDMMKDLKNGALH